MLRRGAKNRPQGMGYSQVGGPRHKAWPNNNGEKARKRMHRSVAGRHRIGTLVQSQVFLKCTLFSLLMIGFLWTQLGFLGDLTDFLAWHVLYLLNCMPPTSAAVMLPVYNGEWPTVEMRNRKSIEEYHNEYLAAVLGGSPGPVMENALKLSDAVSERWIVSVEPVAAHDSLAWWQTYSLQARLDRVQCTSRWFCQRCLAFPLAGSLSSCQAWCPRCYLQELEATKQIHLPSLRVQAEHETANSSPSPSIPRILYNIGTFDDRPMVRSHPDWMRAQNSWRLQSDYEYHSFPTVRQQRHWIVQHYPDLFVAAFDYLEGDPRQRQLFALLLLFRTGGIVAYMDLTLDGQLDAILYAEKDISLAVAIQSGLDDNSHQCPIYEGLLASHPGHAVIENAIETLLYILVLEEQQHSTSTAMMEELQAYLGRYFDLSSLQTWKLRWLPSLARGCPLAVALHGALQHPSLNQPCTLGAQTLPDGETVMLWIMMEQDTGATRITDVGRNLLVASTDLRGWDARPVVDRSSGAKRVGANNNKKPSAQEGTDTTRLYPFVFSWSEYINL